MQKHDRLRIIRETLGRELHLLAQDLEVSEIRLCAYELGYAPLPGEQKLAACLNIPESILEGSSEVEDLLQKVYFAEREQAEAVKKVDGLRADLKRVLA